MTTKECKDNSKFCYVLPEGEYNDILKAKNKDNWYVYPERYMSLKKVAEEFLPPSGYNIITENPWIIGSYDRHKVFILQDGKWEHPEFQTFGCSINLIYEQLLGITSLMSRLPKTMLNELIGR